MMLKYDSQILATYYDLPHFKFVYGPIEEKLWYVKQNNYYYQRIHGTESRFENVYLS